MVWLSTSDIGIIDPLAHVLCLNLKEQMNIWVRDPSSAMASLGVPWSRAVTWDRVAWWPCSRLPRKSHVRLLAWMAALVKDGWLDMRSTGQGGSNKPWHPGIPQRLRLSCQKKALGLIDNEMLTLALELSNIELFKYCTKKSHSIKCYYKHANELTQMFISGSDWMIVLKSLLNKTCLKKIK